MYKLIPNQDISALGFKKEVLYYFNFLVKAYARPALKKGFEVVYG